MLKKWMTLVFCTHIQSPRENGKERNRKRNRAKLGVRHELCLQELYTPSLDVHTNQQTYARKTEKIEKIIPLCANFNEINPKKEKDIAITILASRLLTHLRQEIQKCVYHSSWTI
jgi:hypothetical protein